MNHSLPIPMSPSRALLLFLASLSAADGGDSKSSVATSGDWEFSISAGPAWRQAGTLGFNGGSRSGGYPLPSFVGDNQLIVPPIGLDNGIGDRIYNDGFVRLDPSTTIDGLTTNWGYQNAGQVSGDDLAFHATGFQSVRSDTLQRTAAPSFDHRERLLAPFIQFDATYREVGGIRPGFSASLSWVPVSMGRQWSDFSLTQTRDDFRHDWTDHYNLGGFGSFIPSAPYSGTPEGPGFTLENIPDARDFVSTQIGTESALIHNQVSTRFSADHGTFSFGPTVERRIDASWTLEAGLGISLHWLHWSAQQQETLTVTTAAASSTLANWHDASSGNQVMAGLYLQVGAEWMPKDQDWSIKGFIRADIGDDFSKQIGPSRVTYDTDGFSAGVMLTHRF